MNEQLRSHVTSTAFSLTLGRTHIAALVWLDWAIENDADSIDPSIGRIRYSYFVSGIQGCERRGLVMHCYRPDFKDASIRHHYTILRAGKLVIKLLKEAGIWQEMQAEFGLTERKIA